MSDLKLTLPPMNVDQTRWSIFITPPPMFTSEPQAWWCKLIYSVLMWLSYRAGSFWHWTYYKAQPFGPITHIEQSEPVLYGITHGDGTITTKEQLDERLL